MDVLNNSAFGLKIFRVTLEFYERFCVDYDRFPVDYQRKRRGYERFSVDYEWLNKKWGHPA